MEAFQNMRVWLNRRYAYFKVSGKDYIVASDENSVYFLDRTGNKRLNLKEAVTRSKGSAMRLTRFRSFCCLFLS